MNRLFEKFWLLTAVLCLVTTLSACFSIANEANESESKEKSGTEQVEFEGSEAVNQRREEREDKIAFFDRTDMIVADDLRGRTTPGFITRTERTFFNGFGGYLRT